MCEKIVGILTNYGFDWVSSSSARDMISLLNLQIYEHSLVSILHIPTLQSKTMWDT